MRIVVALGGNALLPRGQNADFISQRRNLEAAAAAVAAVAREHTVVLIHGNGPQVGLLALQSMALEGVEPFPLDLLGAQSEGMIGYLLERELRNCLPHHDIATLLTQVVVDPQDPAFDHPTKPIGPSYPEHEARILELQYGWTVARDGDGYRRVVPSPAPLEFLERRTIQMLVEAGVLVVCAGGGGIPVLASTEQGVKGVEAVIDKDLSAALLAEELAADMLLLLTDVESVYLDYGTPDQRPIRRATPEAIREHGFAEGSMGPKIHGACRFVERAFGTACIGSLRDAEKIIRGEAGTTIREFASAGLVLGR